MEDEPLNNKEISARWDAAARVWAETVRSRGDIHREAVNNPAMFKMLGTVEGKRILDLGCGEGYNTRILAERGAKVVGIDASKEMIKLARAKEEEEPLGIEYHVADAARLSMLEDGSFDIVVAFMSLMDIKDLEGAMREVGRVLKRDGRFLFSIIHPCFDRFRDDLGWERDEEGKKLYYKVDDYFDEGPKEFVFTLGGGKTVLPRKMIHFHRTLTTYFHALHKAGLVVTRLEEPRPSQAALEQYPQMEDLLRIPNFMVAEARKLP
jgi:SAM-dependent methyltransferase